MSDQTLSPEDLRTYIFGRLDNDDHQNSVSRLVSDLHQDLIDQKTDTKGLIELARSLSDDSLAKRAQRLSDYIGLGQVDVLEMRIIGCIRAWHETGIDHLKSKLESPQFGLVFTGHPTFLLSSELSTSLKNLSLGHSLQGPLPLHEPDKTLSLEDEHAKVQAALQQARDAEFWLIQVAMRELRQLVPDQWQDFTPCLITLASWVGYDQDGRTDIKWHHSFTFRLQEKAQMLADYFQRSEQLLGADAPATQAIEQELRAVASDLHRFHRGMSDPAAMAQAANALTMRDGKQVTASELSQLVKQDAKNLGHEDSKLQALSLAALIASRGLGTGHIHLRINATQLQNAHAAALGLGDDSQINDPDAYRLHTRTLTQDILNLEPEQVNFAALALEQSTAIRQFLYIAQVVKHIDAQAPIRFLIAETETPITVLIALYLAQRFGVSDAVDISPLFETPDALELGARLIEQLLENDAYRAYVEKRGRLCIQAGFSDAGRFLGQIPATLAIERLQVQLARALDRKGLKHIEVLIFNTHGESMGRGAHPTSFESRLAYVFSPYARSSYKRFGLKVTQETSIQGGDGYLLFSDQALARATMARALTYEWSHADGDALDPYYQDKAFALDTFLALKNWQEDMYHAEDYRTLLGTFGTNLLFNTGSRKAKRQMDKPSSRLLGNPSLLRAIPHNASLQQLGMPANVVAGLGTIINREAGRFEEVYSESKRLQSLLSMVAHAYSLTSVEVVKAYGALFEPLTWSEMMCKLPEGQALAMERLAEQLESDPRRYGLRDFASKAERDLQKLKRLFERLKIDTKELPTSLLALHVIRIVLIRQSFVLAASLPSFSPNASASFGDVIAAILVLDTEQAVDMLKQAFPLNVDLPEWTSRLEEDSSYSPYQAAQGGSYQTLNEQKIDPLGELYLEIRRISVGIAHFYGAHG